RILALRPAGFLNLAIGESNQVGHGELTVLLASEFTGLRFPVRLNIQEESRIGHKQPNENLRDYAAANRAQSSPFAKYFSLFQDVIPERSGVAEELQQFRFFPIADLRDTGVGLAIELVTGSDRKFILAGKN